jgi:hypothetical protein
MTKDDKVEAALSALDIDSKIEAALTALDMVAELKTEGYRLCWWLVHWYGSTKQFPALVKIPLKNRPDRLIGKLVLKSNNFHKEHPIFELLSDGAVWKSAQRIAMLERMIGSDSDSKFFNEQEIPF